MSKFSTESMKRCSGIEFFCDGNMLMIGKSRGKYGYSYNGSTPTLTMKQVSKLMGAVPYVTAKDWKDKKGQSLYEYIYLDVDEVPKKNEHTEIDRVRETVDVKNLLKVANAITFCEHYPNTSTIIGEYEMTTRGAVLNNLRKYLSVSEINAAFNELYNMKAIWAKKVDGITYYRMSNPLMY